jgi:hypothetical protein
MQINKFIRIMGNPPSADTSAMGGETWHPLALIRLANAASQLPCGSGKTKGEGVPLHFCR